jgi:hypothetical protein
VAECYDTPALVAHLREEARKDRECGWPNKAAKKEQAAELLAAACPAIHLTRSSGGTTTVAIDVGGRWVNVITEHGDIISHIVEPLGIRRAIERAFGVMAALPVATDRDLHSHMMVVAMRVAEQEHQGQKALLRAVCRAIADDKNLRAKLARGVAASDGSKK